MLKVTVRETMKGQLTKLEKFAEEVERRKEWELAEAARKRQRIAERSRKLRELGVLSK